MEPAAAPVAERPTAAPPPAIDVALDGTVLAGSMPGTPGRRPGREADAVPVALAPYRIDRLPYPNDPLVSPLLVATRREAEQWCERRDARLCSELEWERACEGDGHDPFPGGPTLDVDRCAGDVAACPSGTGTLAMGFSAPEWTSSEVPADQARLGRIAVQRGARLDAPLAHHRCDARAFEVPDAATPAAFRCCVGAGPSPAYPTPDAGREFEDLALSNEQAQDILRGVPELARFADGFALHGLEDADRALARGGRDRAALAGWEPAPGPFAWSPSPGEATWVLSGTSAGSTLIAVLYPLPDRSFRHAGSFILEGEAAPLVISRTRPSRAELRWSPCWGCIGEGGTIRFDDESASIRVVSN